MQLLLVGFEAGGSGSSSSSSSSSSGGVARCRALVLLAEGEAEEFFGGLKACDLSLRANARAGVQLAAQCARLVEAGSGVRLTLRAYRAAGEEGAGLGAGVEGKQQYQQQQLSFRVCAGTRVVEPEAAAGGAGMEEEEEA